MFALVTTLILYTCGFIFLYGVIRLAVRHGILDAEARRAEAMSQTPDRPRDPFLANS